MWQSERKRKSNIMGRAFLFAAWPSCFWVRIRVDEQAGDLCRFVRAARPALIQLQRSGASVFATRQCGGSLVWARREVNDALSSPDETIGQATKMENGYQQSW
jgi:hypothetical protein